MASLPLSLSSPSPTLSRLSVLHTRSRPLSSLSLSYSHHLRRTLRLNPTRRTRLLKLSSSAYVSGPAADYAVTEPDPKVDGFQTENYQTKDAINWELLWALLLEHKWRLTSSSFTPPQTLALRQQQAIEDVSKSRHQMVIGQTRLSNSSTCRRKPGGRELNRVRETRSNLTQKDSPATMAATLEQE
ncbi:hypothetical protein Cgig2_029982 [Carnegiea gigantea]|uniref:Uncharacterized protein n=1 Tax=Carnegiea gigantea TaxID=171969 RepID=A0A9Q1QDY5_9CARY|nr:hypothetical protein Cgig2_029982 [Carnegiea gigantea]